LGGRAALGDLRSSIPGSSCPKRKPALRCRRRHFSIHDDEPSTDRSSHRGSMRGRNREAVADPRADLRSRSTIYVFAIVDVRGSMPRSSTEIHERHREHRQPIDARSTRRPRRNDRKKLRRSAQILRRARIWILNAEAPVRDNGAGWVRGDRGVRLDVYGVASVLLNQVASSGSALRVMATVTLSTDDPKGMEPSEARSVLQEAHPSAVGKGPAHA
jgi:hypothetical protein